MYVDTVEIMLFILKVDVIKYVSHNQSALRHHPGQPVQSKRFLKSAFCKFVTISSAFKVATEKLSTVN